MFFGLACPERLRMQQLAYRDYRAQGNRDEISVEPLGVSYEVLSKLLVSP